VKAVTWHGIGDIRLEEVPDPRIEAPTDAIVRITTSAICGTDLHLVRGTMPGMKEGTILGHEAVGEVVEVGSQVRDFSPDDRVIVPSTIACGYCSYCRAGYSAKCDNANPVNKEATAFFGGPQSAGGFSGLQAQYARIPYANYGLVPIPGSMTDQQAVMLCDIFPTAWFGAHLAEVRHGDTVAVFGAGPVGQLAILSAYLRGAGRVIAVDRVEDRLALARLQHAEVVNFDVEDPVAVIKELTGGIGVDRVIDAVGVDAVRPASGPAAEQAQRQAQQFDQQRQQVSAQADGHGDGHGAGYGDAWLAGDAPGQALQWAVQSVAKAGSIGIIGTYPPAVTWFPFGAAFSKNLTIKAGDCSHRRYLPELVEMVASGTVDPAVPLTEQEPMNDVLAAYHEFDRREPGWVKVALATA
jgi:threonine dehydrogenase-like Zn-dependent dehydrogenase